MKFYIELSNRINTYRLQNDKSWRALKSRKLMQSDFLTSKSSEIIQLQEHELTLNLEDKDWKINHSAVNKLGDRSHLYYNVYVNRSFFPKLPSKEQLISVMKQGDDRMHNSLILNVFGFYELRNFHTLILNIKDPTIVYRNETWSRGNGYVGEEILKNSAFLDSIYENSLEYWLTHLQNGLTNMYSDIQATMTLDEIISEIKLLEKKSEQVESED